MSASENATTITEHETGQLNRANASGLVPVVFVHGLWLLPSSWERWADLIETAGYVALTPGWPDDPETTGEAAAHPEAFAHKSIGQVADHFGAIASSLARKPVIIGHSFGGLLAQILAGRGQAAVTFAIIRRRSAACCRCRSRRCEQHQQHSATPPTGTARSR